VDYDRRRGLDNRPPRPMGRPPRRKGRVAILGIHTRGIPLNPSVDLEHIARSTTGFSGACGNYRNSE
jgi:SpoVK/Ycf46/Vps4 family AAA+-type ATPase